MALVSVIEPSQKDRTSVHRPTRCLFSIVGGEAGTRYLQLDTMGSDERQFADEVSQSIQFDKQEVQQLLQLIRQTFPDLP